MNRITDQELQELHGLLLKLSTIGIEADLINRCGLGDIDIAILNAIAHGHNVRSIPKVIKAKMSHRTVEAHVNAMRAAWGAINMPHLVHLAHVKGVL